MDLNQNVRSGPSRRNGGRARFDPYCRTHGSGFRANHAAPAGYPNYQPFHYFNTLGPLEFYPPPPHRVRQGTGVFCPQQPQPQPQPQYPPEYYPPGLACSYPPSPHHHQGQGYRTHLAAGTGYLDPAVQPPGVLSPSGSAPAPYSPYYPPLAPHFPLVVSSSPPPAAQGTGVYLAQPPADFVQPPGPATQPPQPEQLPLPPLPDNIDIDPLDVFQRREHSKLSMWMDGPN